jgi:hypothetical protein
LLGYPRPDLLAGQTDLWEEAPGNTAVVPSAIFLPDQLDRIRDTEFSPIDDVIRSFKGRFEVVENPTYGYRVKDVDLVDGVLYGKRQQRHLRTQETRSLTYIVPQEVMRGVMYESWIGNRWFGTWLHEDCLTYMLAEDCGQIVTTAPEPSGHVPRYEMLLGMAPLRRQNVHFDELIMFEDLPNNAGKAQRALKLRDRLLAGRDITPQSGVFILRGQTGDERVLENEREIAENLATTYGFHILDPMQSSVDVIANVCGQARIIAGIEGSHLLHGLSTMPPGATLLVIQPPERVVATLKMVTDRQGQGFAFVVAEGTDTQFRVSWDEIRHTLDLLA